MVYVVVHIGGRSALSVPLNKRQLTNEYERRNFLKSVTYSLSTTPPTKHT